MCVCVCVCVFWGRPTCPQIYDRKRDVAALIRCFYKRHNPQKLDVAERMLEGEFDGKEESMLQKIAQKYDKAIPSKESCLQSGHFDDGSDDLFFDTMRWTNGDVYEGSWRLTAKGKKQHGNGGRIGLSFLLFKPVTRKPILTFDHLE